MLGGVDNEIRSDEGPSVAIEITDSADCHRSPLDTTCSISNTSTSSSGDDFTLFSDCRICLQTDSISNLLRPCSCEGTLSHVHYTCLQSWVKESRKLKCEICGESYTNETKEKLAEVVAVAEQGDQEQRNTNLGAQLDAISGANHITTTHQTPTRCRLYVFLLVFVAFAFAAIRVQSSGAFPTWVGSLLEVIAVAIPVLLIVRLLLALQRQRNQEDLDI